MSASRALLPCVLPLMLLLGNPATADDPELLDPANPLRPPDTSSPRATLQSFLADSTSAWEAFLDPSGPRTAAWARRIERAARCFDLSQVPPAERSTVALETTILMLDVFNRIAMPVSRQVPDADAMEAKGRTRWTLPGTSIQLERMLDGAREGEWLFSREVVESARRFYYRTRHLPVGKGAVVEDGFSLFLARPGTMIPLSWVAGLPPWASRVYLEQTLWQWAALAILVALAGTLGTLAVRWSRRPAPETSSQRAVAGPASLMLLAVAVGYLVDQQVNITGSVLSLVRTVAVGVFYLSLAWATLLLGRVAADRILVLPRFRRDRASAQLARVATRLTSIALAALIVGIGLRQLGVPVLGVVAGLGVGGLAVALAAQTTIENFIGSLTIYADRPVRVGDFCRFGSQMGTVEHIGLRSTRIRTLERSLLTVPNAEFSRLQIDNLAHRDRRLFRNTLNLSLETGSEQLQQILDGIRELLLSHDAVSNEPARVRLVAMGPHSLDLEIFAYVLTADNDRFLAIREEIFMRILAIVEKAGSALAPPASVTYLHSADRDEPSHRGEPKRQPDAG